MSQLPPTPGYPSQPGSPASYGMAPTPKRSNGPAIGSLVCGLLGCVPFITGLLAVILGIVGIRKTKDPHVGGKGLAIAGLILGIVSIGAWALFGSAILALVVGTQANRDLAGKFIKDLGAGNVQAASASASSLAPGDLQAMSDEVKGYGAVADVTTFGTNIVNNTAELAGMVKFADGSAKAFHMKQVKSGDAWKVTELRFE